MPDRSRYVRLEALFRRGKTIEFSNGTLMWVQVMNPLEADNAREEASTARARIVLALKEFGSDEQSKALYEFSQLPRKSAVEAIVNSQQTRWLAQADDKLRDDPDWKERMEIFDRRDALEGRPVEDSERQLLEKITSDYLAEIYRRVGEDADFERERLEGAPEEEVRERWMELYRERRGEQAAFMEQQITAAWYGARVCEARKLTEGEVVNADDVDSDGWYHGSCAGHQMRVYETKADYKAAALEIQNAVMGALVDLNLSIRDTKNSDSAATSSESLAQQEQPEESTPSIPAATP
jgi:hypothetical protein